MPTRLPSPTLAGMTEHVDPPVRVDLLGPVEVRDRRATRPVTGLRRRTVLVALALRAGQVVPVQVLAEALWAGAPPATALNTLQSHVSQLRHLLGGRAAIAGHGGGYRLAAGTDAAAADALVRRAACTADPRRRAADLGEALALWRGRPLADVAPGGWFDLEARRLEQLRAGARRALVDARLDLGETASVLADLRALTAVELFDERLHGQLMVTLYRCGRQAEALAVYHRLRRRLAVDLGVEPGRRLRDLELAILRQDPSLDVACGECALPRAC
jgi:DNA-binding SARP family transcriptional activator